VTPKTVAAVAALVRLPNGLVAAAAVIVGGRWAGAEWGSARVALAAGSAVALTAVANAFNDYQDRVIDLVVHPDRPIPNGMLAPEVALGITGVAAIIGVGLSGAASSGLGWLSVGVVVAMVGYGRIKAWSGVAANALVAVLGALPFLYGAWAAGAPRAAVPLMALAAPLQLAREVAKDVDDVDGDRGRRWTLPLVAGLPTARAVGAGAAIVAVLILVAIGVRMSLRLRPLVGVALLPAGVCAVAGGWRLVRGSRGAPTAFKIAMALAILVMLAVPRH